MRGAARRSGLEVDHDLAAGAFGDGTVQFVGLVDVVAQVVEVSPRACAEIVPGQEVPTLPASGYDLLRVQYPLFWVGMSLPKIPPCHATCRLNRAINCGA